MSVFRTFIYIESSGQLIFLHQQASIAVQAKSKANLLRNSDGICLLITQALQDCTKFITV